MPTVLLEIGTEEVPASYLPPALAQLGELARARLEAGRITYSAIETWGTPRRITLYVTEMAEHQAPAVREVRGPTVQAAFAINGEPTQAATGFARSYGIAVHDLRIKKIDNVEYVMAVFHDENRPTAEMLPAIFRDLIGNLTFPKTMRWGSGAFRFARPIRWLVALMDEQVIPVAIDGVAAGHLTRGHRFLSPGEVDVPLAADYRRIMDENQVMVDHAERREAIRAQLEAIAVQDGATVVDDGSLLEATTFHVEFPTAVRCAFDPQFLALPTEVIHLVLRGEQEFFPLAAPNGDLLPAFIGVRNGDKAYLSGVREGYESVARAKLIDALFFFEQDQRIRLADRVEALRGVVFLERLGTMYDKMERLQLLAGAIADLLYCTAGEHDLLQRAALLAKADLVTSMVIEHPELQGAMGSVYARKSGEAEQVACAIGEQYRPRSATDSIPESLLGSLLALADKLDTVAACFAAGLLPTGSEDPYGLRREAQGVVRILAEKHYPLSLSRLIAQALSPLTQVLAQSREDTQATVENFFRQRVEYLLLNEGLPNQVVHATMGAYADVPARALECARVMHELRDDPAFAGVARVATRLNNISKNFPGGEIRAELLRDPAEQQLHACYAELAPRATSLAAQGDFAGLFTLLAELIPVVDRFFSDILVMAKEPDLRQNRLALAWSLANVFRLFGDLTQIG